MNRTDLALGSAALMFMAVVPTNCASAAPAGVSLQAPPVTPKFFGTTAIKISAKRFWSDWERARRDASSLPEMRRLIAPAIRLPRARQIAYVQSAVSRMIQWRSDTTQWGRHDYWASAAETLKRGLGDMEDRAIVKMQALRALGVPTSDLYFTLGRDTVGGPQTVLIVRDGPAYYVLDDTGGPPYRPAHRPEFHPVLTFGYGAAWVHGKAPATAKVAGKRSTGAARAFAPTH
jgi:predicted transglutaminase-like cysteine proteinase